MLEDPYTHKNVYDCHDLFYLQVPKQEVDVQSLIPTQAAQLHQGMILTDKDAAQLEANNKFKSIELNEKFLNISVNDIKEENILDREIANYKAQQEVKGFAPSAFLEDPANLESAQSSAINLLHHPGTGFDTSQLTLYQLRRLNQEHQAQQKEMAWAKKTFETQQYRAEKDDEKEYNEMQKRQKLDTLKQEVEKQREIKRIIKAEQKNELDKNL